MHPNQLIGSLAQDRHAARYRDARQLQQDKRLIPGPSRLETTRRRAGWLLVDLGLRLISSGRHAARVSGHTAG